MLVIFLIIPFIGAIYMSLNASYSLSLYQCDSLSPLSSKTSSPDVSKKSTKYAVLKISVSALLVSFVLFALLDISINQFQYVQECHDISYLNLYIGLDPLSIFFILLTTIIIPISFLSNSTSIRKNLKLFFVCILLLEALLLSVFAVLDSLFYYVFFESILPPLFVFIGSYGSKNRIRASFYLFLYTLLGSLFLLLSILSMSSLTGITDLDTLYKISFDYITQIFVFCGIFIAFAVKTPTVFLNTWLLKAHVESPISGSIILAAIVLKLSLYGILRLILPLLPKASLAYTLLIYVIGVITIYYASVSTLRTVDVKELIAYSSVCHAAVYLMSVFSNTIQGIEGGISLGLAHGFVSSGLFLCAGAVLYDRSITRLITHYRGMAQIMPLFSVLFFILCLGNCGAPLTLNFVGEFLSLYGAFERLPLLGVLASSSIIFSAAYTIYMYNRIVFAGSFSKFFKVNISDLNKREFYILLTLVLFTLVLGVYPAPVLDGLHYSVTALIYSFIEDGFTLTNGDNLLGFIPFFLPKKARYLKTKISNWVLWILNSPPKPHSFIDSPRCRMIPHHFTHAIPYGFSVILGYIFAIAFMGVVQFDTGGDLLPAQQNFSNLDFFRFLYDMENIQDHTIYRPAVMQVEDVRYILYRLVSFRSHYVETYPDNVQAYDHVINQFNRLNDLWPNVPESFEPHPSSMRASSDDGATWTNDLPPSDPNSPGPYYNTSPEPDLSFDPNNPAPSGPAPSDPTTFGVNNPDLSYNPYGPAPSDPAPSDSAMVYPTSFDPNDPALFDSASFDPATFDPNDPAMFDPASNGPAPSASFYPYGPAPSASFDPYGPAASGSFYPHGPAPSDPAASYNPNNPAASYNPYNPAASYNPYNPAASYNPYNPAASDPAALYNPNNPAASYNPNNPAASYNPYGPAASYPAASYNPYGPAPSDPTTFGLNDPAFIDPYGPAPSASFDPNGPAPFDPTSFDPASFDSASFDPATFDPNDPAMFDPASFDRNDQAMVDPESIDRTDPNDPALNRMPRSALPDEFYQDLNRSMFELTNSTSIYHVSWRMDRFENWMSHPIRTCGRAGLGRDEVHPVLVYEAMVHRGGR